MNTLDFFEQLFNPIIMLEENDKIGMELANIINKNNLERYINLENIKWKLYIDQSSYLQPISRWYYGSNRKDIFNNMLVIFQTYNKFYSYIILNSTICFAYNVNIVNRLTILRDKVITGLDKLKNTYKDDDNIMSLIDMMVNLMHKPYYKNLF